MKERGRSVDSLQGDQGAEECKSRQGILIPSSENSSRGAERWRRGRKSDVDELLITHPIGLWVLGADCKSSSWVKNECRIQGMEGGAWWAMIKSEIQGRWVAGQGWEQNECCCHCKRCVIMERHWAPLGRIRRVMVRADYWRGGGGGRKGEDRS